MDTTLRREFSPEEDRLLIDLADLYDAWRQAARAGLKGRYRWKNVNGTDYLYLLRPGSDTGKSLGPRSVALEQLHEEHQQLYARAKTTWPRLLLKGRMLKAVRIPMVTAGVGEALRDLDLAGLLGDYVRVVGSVALPAYEIAAGVKLDPALHATEDMDFTWVAPKESRPAPSALLDVLKRSDDTWTVNTERPFQLRNRKGDLLDVLVGPSLRDGYPAREKVRASVMESQDWLLGGTPVDVVLVDLAGKPARVVAPDPRLFALHKLQMSQQPASVRRREKSAKDLRQALAVLDLVETRMPEYPLDEAFVSGIAEPLQAQYRQWRLESAQAKPTSGRRARP